MIFKFKKHYKLKKKLQNLIDCYKTTTALYNSLIFYSPTDKKEILLYFQTIKYLQDAHVVNHYQAAILQLDQDPNYRICLFSQFNGYTVLPKSLTSNAHPFTNIIICTMAFTKL